MTARQLHDDLRRRRDTLRQVLDLCRLQLQVIDSNDYDSLWRIQQQKQALYARLAERLQESTGLRPEDLVVSVTENAREDWSFGNGVAQFVVGQL